MREIEIKIKLDDKQSVLDKVKELGGEFVESGMFKDIYFDDGKGFYENGKVLRLRQSENGAMITYKEPPNEPGVNILNRLELQTDVSDYKTTKEIFEKLGFVPYVKKDKKYENYKVGKVIVEFHELPFLGEYLEIEGTEDQIKEIIPKIGLSIEQGIGKGYNTLFDEYKITNGLPDDVQDTYEDAAKYQ